MYSAVGQKLVRYQSVGFKSTTSNQGITGTTSMIDKTTKSYHKTIVWQKLKDLLLITYKLTDKLPKSEEFGLKPQMRRAVVSAISNFVEGYLVILKEVLKIKTVLWKFLKLHS